ncbi:hypothetical protein [Bacteroides sp. 519]|uniref:hypothetical protein n=1 Tax=Bacteroides sp. 519 TaxID=2302937 RepID=UPI0013D37FA0|nr:hypothetical protein [Bacteroides sp. 519]NDV57873.1 hypothetical protein [Bacteroides sp. 519]
MARKEINIFGTSFLDLLSGALGAVIILFIIVPKMTQENVELIKKVKEIEVIASDVEELLEKVKNSVPTEVFNTLKEEMETIKSKMSELKNKLAELEKEIQQITEENRTLKETVQTQQEEIEKLKAKLAEMTTRATEAEEKNKPANTVEKTLGVFAKFGILCKWEESNTDVDMGVQRFGMSPEQCWRMYPSKSWGILGEDVREREISDQERFELFYVPQIYPDEYTVWINIYKKSSGTNANVTCILIFHPGKPDEQRKEIGPIYLSSRTTKCVVSFRLSNFGFEIISHREPQWGEGEVIK